jgi:hypothetical protein
MYKKSRSRPKKIWITVLLIALITIGVVVIWHVHHKKNLNLASNTSIKTPITGTLSKPQAPSLPTAPSTPSGGVVDQQGNVSDSLPPSSDITLQQPSPNSTVQSGDTLSGLANVSTVDFILTDNSVGLIAQGSLNVVNGKFSGTLAFTPHSSTGKLEVFSPNPQTGAEENIIDTDVNFNTQP